MAFSDIVIIIKNYVNTYSGIPGIVFFIFFLNFKKSNSRIVFFILLLSFIADFSNYFFIRYVYPNSYIITNTWWLTNFLLVSWFFIDLMPQRRKFIVTIGVIFFLGSLISFSYFYSFLESNTFIGTFSSIYFTFLALLTFFEILREGPVDRLINYPVFWIATGIFLHSSITILKFLFQNYLVFEMNVTWELLSYTSLFNLIFNITKNLMFFYAFILVKKGYPDYIYPPKTAIA